MSTNYICIQVVTACLGSHELDGFGTMLDCIVSSMWEYRQLWSGLYLVRLGMCIGVVVNGYVISMQQVMHGGAEELLKLNRRIIQDGKSVHAGTSRVCMWNVSHIPHMLSPLKRCTPGSE